ncbi:MAG: hypothetical protein K0S44_1048 [Bacteroidetes bacterium]|jgi:hypothetical protein|nr:hypothetical protein [Bacteroidota bacterium]
MKELFCKCSLLLLVINSNAQEVIHEQPVIPKVKKNEIFLNTAPLFRMLLNAGEPAITRFSITYKRAMTDKSAFRFSLMADMVNKDGHYPHNRKETIILKSDSVLIKQKNISPGYVSPHLNLGYERLFGKRKLKWFFGADLTFGYAASRSYTNQVRLVKDPGLGTNTWVEVGETEHTIASVNRKILAFGLSPFFGAKYPISKRFFISAQVGADMTYRIEDITEHEGLSKKNYKVTVFDFDQAAGVINDISIVYKF